MSQADNFAINDKAVQDFVLTGEVTAAEVTAGASVSLASGPTKWMSLTRVFGVITKLVATLAQIRAGTDDTTIVTPLKLKQRGNEFSKFTTLPSSTVLTADDVGSIICMANWTGAATLTLPATSSVPAGAMIAVSVGANYAVTLAVGTGDTLNSPIDLPQAFVLAQGDTAILVRVQSEWRVVTGSAALPFSTSFRAALRGLSATINTALTPTANTAINITRAMTSFVAPCDGFVLATQALNCGAQPATIQSYIAITGSTTGTTKLGESVPGSQFSTVVLKVLKGETVNVTGTVTATSTTSTWLATGIQTSYVFVPTTAA